MLKTLQIPNCIPLVVSGQHSLKAGIFVPINEVLIDVQSDPLDTGIGGGQAANTAPFPGKVIPLRFREPFGGLFEPEVDICLVHILFHKAAFVNEWHNGSVIHTVLDGIFVDQLTELRHGVLLFFHQRSTGKANVAGIGEHRPHFGGQQTIVGAVAFIHQQKHIPRKILVLHFFSGVELIDDGSDHIRLAAAQQLYQIPSTGGSGRIETGVSECGRDLAIQFLAVRNNDYFRVTVGQFH